MAELHTNLYINNTDAHQHHLLTKLFMTINDPTPAQDISIEQHLNDLAAQINPKNGVDLSAQLGQQTHHFGADINDLVAESYLDESNYAVYHFVHSDNGTELINAIVNYIGRLSPDSDIRACSASDDEPWEVFFRWQDNQVKQQYFEPDDVDIDEDELPQVYQWWHQGLPPQLKDGFIHQWQDEDED